MNLPDPRLTELSDCIYRIAVKAIIVKDDHILLNIEDGDEGWAFPGGGVDYGEMLDQALIRELGEELGIAEENIHSDFKIATIQIGHIAREMPRANIFYIVDVNWDRTNLTTKDKNSEFKWFSYDELISTKYDPSNGDMTEVLKAIQPLLSSGKVSSK